MNLQTILYALLGGVLPALVWLLFWLREDSKSPEPRNILVRTFLFGMLSVALVLPFQKGVELLIPELTLISLFLWAALEEVFKFGAGYFGGLHSVDDNEPLDPMIYMITASLGFVALENTLFIFGPLLGGDTSAGLVTGNMRFIGASLLHVVSSGIIGAALSLSFYQSRAKRILWGIIAIVIAIAFHTFFNFLIITHGNLGTTTAFFLVWAVVVFLLLVFEKIKTIAPETNSGII